MKLPDEKDRKSGFLKHYKNNGTRYTPSLKNGQWVILALVADVGWLTNLILVIAYFSLNGFHTDIAALVFVNVFELLSVTAVQVGYGFDIYTSVIGEKAQQTRLQKNMGFGLPAIGSFAAVIFGIAQAVCVSKFASEGLIFTVFATIGAFISFVCCTVIFRSFQEVRGKNDSDDLPQ